MPDRPPVAAWRCWGLARPLGVLHSCLDPNHFDVQWAPGNGWQEPAWCTFHEHYAPDGGETCARCGWRGQPDLSQLTWWLADFKRARPMVIGRVELGGTILQGDRSHPEIPGILRAERIRVTGPLVVAPGYERHAAPLAARYGAGVLLSSAPRFDLSWVRSAPADLASAARSNHTEGKPS